MSLREVLAWIMVGFLAVAIAGGGAYYVIYTYVLPPDPSDPATQHYGARRPPALNPQEPRGGTDAY